MDTVWDTIIDAFLAIVLITGFVLMYVFSNKRHIRNTKGCEQMQCAIPVATLHTRFLKEIRDPNKLHGPPYKGRMWRDGHFYLQYSPASFIGWNDIAITMTGIVEGDTVYYKFSGISRNKERDKERLLQRFWELCLPEPASPQQEE